jgi:hypothetical protein
LANDAEHTPHFKPFEPACSACRKIEEQGGYTSTLGVVHTYSEGCKHKSQEDEAKRAAEDEGWFIPVDNETIMDWGNEW